MSRPTPAQAAANTPFAGLDPQQVIAAIESLGLESDGRVLALNSYENRVFRIGLHEHAPVVAKFYRPGRWSDAAILEEHAFAAELLEAGVSVVPPLRLHTRTLHPVGPHRIALFPLQGGRAPDIEQREVLQSLGRSLALLHAVGARKPFRERIELDVESYGDNALDVLLDSALLPLELAEPLQRIAEDVLDRVDERWESCDAQVLRLHGDCHPGNLLWRDDVAHFVDLDDCLTGPAMQDLWMLLSGEAEQQRRQCEWLLEGYIRFREFDAGEVVLIEALRSLRLLHFHAWVAKRWDDPAFPAAFPWFAERRHWERLIQQLQEQLALLQESPAWSV